MLIEDKKKLPIDFPVHIEHYREKRREGFVSDVAHWHNFFEITYVEEGSANYYVNGKQYNVSSGDSIIFNHTEAHRWEVTSEEVCLKVLIFSSNLIADGFSINDIDYLIPFLERGSNFTNKISRTKVHSEEIQKLMEEIFLESTGSKPGKRLMIKADILRILTILVRYYQKNEESDESLWEKKNGMHRIGISLDYIRNQYHRKLTLEEVASTVYMSPNYFSAFFKKVTGGSFQDYLSKVRIEKAQKLLKTTDNSILEVAHKVGIQNVSNFYRLYKKYTDRVPGEERQ